MGRWRLWLEIENYPKCTEKPLKISKRFGYCDLMKLFFIIIVIVQIDGNFCGVWIDKRSV